jgi:hypothetical protein
VRALARLAVLLGAIGLGAFLFRAVPREVVLVYDLARVPGATSVEVAVRKGGELVRRAELTVPASGSQVRHRVELREGDYELEYRVAAAGGALQGRRSLEVREGGTIVLPLGP